MKLLTAFFLALSFGLAQPAPQGDPEEQELSQALAEAGNSPIEFIRALEKHLRKHPESRHKSELERALVKAAIENRDEKRIIEYGERVLARDPDDVQILDRVTRALLSSEDRQVSERALKYAKRYEQAVTAMRSRPVPSRAGGGQWQDELDKGLGRALVLEARATGNLGKLEEAAALAARSYEAYPNAESAREIGRWLARLGKDDEAVAHIADAFAMADTRTSDADRAKDRTRMGEIYAKAHGSEKGLGDVILQAYDRTTAVLAARRLRLRDTDPNSLLTNPMEFTLSGLDGQKLQLASLKGKTVVFDFWATWCGPCRAQQPLYEEVRRNFQDRPEVVFLSVNTDEDRSQVQPFLKDQKWEQRVWFEDGLSRVLQISSIPTTIVVDKRGDVVSRMNGYVPDRFVDMLSERIREALKN